MSKKIISLMLTVIMLSVTAVCLAFSAGAEGTTSVVFDGKTYDVAAGDTFVFETKLTAPDVSAAGGRVILKFDTDLIEVVKNDDDAIYETDLDGVLTVGDYTANGEGCSFAFGGTQYDDDAVLSGDKNVLVRFLMRAKAAGTTEIVFDEKSFDFSVFTSENPTEPVNVVSAGKVVNEDVDYTFIGNEITVKEFEYTQAENPPAKQNGSQQGTDETGSSNGSSDNTDNTDSNGETLSDNSENQNGSEDSVNNSASNPNSEKSSGGIWILIIIIAVIVVCAAVCIVVIVRKNAQKEQGEE